MVARGSRLPQKLNRDAVAEALIEVRFDMTGVPELLFGRLADLPTWKGFIQRAMPASNIPAPMREAEENLKHQPIFELVSPDGRIAIRVGNHVISYHRLQGYIGWEKFQPELFAVIDSLFKLADKLVVKRIGLRYMNVLNRDLHGIDSILDLDLQVMIAGEPLPDNLNLNFTRDLGEAGAVTVRIATPDFVQGSLPKSSSMIIDVDVFTKDGYQTTAQSEVKEWMEGAHTREKEEFFHLLTQKTIDLLEEEV